ncbi:MAG: aminopeptidase N [Planctomycetota bacterium]
MRVKINALVGTFTALSFVVAGCAGTSSSDHGEPTRPLRADSLEHNGWDRDSDLIHVDLSLTLDLESASITGSVRNRVRALVNQTESIQFHSVDLNIASVRDSAGRQLSWKNTGPILQVELAESLERGVEETISIEYSASPQLGLYFRETSKDAKGAAPQVWSQGQAEDTRYWLPTWDYPNDRATFSAHLRVAGEFRALSNGRLVSEVEHENGDRTFHWELDERIPTYLIALAVGRWELYEDDWKGLPVQYWVGPGTGEEKARRAFGETPEMLSYFTDLLGVEYPYSKYAQVAVADFVSGGMENASLTLQHDYVIASPDEHVENDGETRLLVAHELAHQWFGNWVTCFGWSHLWLNEAWATYMELLFERHKSGPETFALWLERYRNDFIARGERTRRPLSEDWRTQLTDMRCSHEYVKGPWVLYMLEHEVGSEAFWQAVHAYLVRHGDGLVQTSDFARSIFDETGRNVEGFLEQWVEAGGHPQYKVRLKTHTAELGPELVLDIEQTQRTSELVPLFDVTVVVEVHDDRGVTRESLRIDEALQEFKLPVVGDLQDLVFDADCQVLCEIDMQKTPAMWAHQAHKGSAALRWRALGELDAARREGAGQAERALREIAYGDSQVILRREARRYLSLGRDVSFLLQCFDKESDDLARLELLELVSRRKLSAQVVNYLTESFAERDSERATRALERLHDGILDSEGTE